MLRRAVGAWRPAITPAVAALGLVLAGGAPSFAQPPAEPTAAGLSAYQRQLLADQAAHPTLKIGAAMPDFSLKGTDGKMHTPKDYKDAKILIVAFISNHCPASQVYEGRIKQLAADYASRGVQLIAIQPDGPKAAALSGLMLKPSVGKPK